VLLSVASARCNQSERLSGRLRLKAASTHNSFSELVDEAVQVALHEDQENISVFSERTDEPEISYEALLDDLKKHGKI
jgi:hypothetical protein